jgi:hypothetical protein
VPLEGLRKYPAAEQNPKSANRQRQLEELIDNLPLFEDSGFLQKIYAAYGVVR